MMLKKSANNDKKDLILFSTSSVTKFDSLKILVQTKQIA